MKFKFCIILLFFFSVVLQGSDFQKLIDSLHVTPETSKNERTDYLHSVAARRTSVSIACVGWLDGHNMKRAGLKEVREALEVVYEDQQGPVRKALDAITEKHRRKAPLFFGYVSSKKLNKERVALKIALNQQLAVEEAQSIAQRALSESMAGSAIANAPVIASVCVESDKE